MGYDLRRTDEVYANKDNQDWLASSHGVDAADSITLDAANLLATYPDGEVPSGVEVSRAAGGLYQLGGTGSAPGFLLHGLRVRSGSNPVGALLWHGEVITARVPGGVAGTHPMIRLV